MSDQKLNIQQPKARNLTKNRKNFNRNSSQITKNGIKKAEKILDDKKYKR